MAIEIPISGSSRYGENVSDFGPGSTQVSRTLSRGPLAKPSPPAYSLVPSRVKSCLPQIQCHLYLTQLNQLAHLSKLQLHISHSSQSGDAYQTTRRTGSVAFAQPCVVLQIAYISCGAGSSTLMRRRGVLALSSVSYGGQIIC